MTIEAAFGNMSKSAITKSGSGPDVVFNLTWPCYFNCPKHCGKCESCVNRRNAFKKAKMAEPAEYV